MVKIGEDRLDPERVTRLTSPTSMRTTRAGPPLSRERLGLSVSIFEGVKAPLEAGDERASSIAAGLFADDFRLRARRVHDRLGDSAVQTIGEFILTCVETPGHCANRAPSSCPDVSAGPCAPVTPSSGRARSYSNRSTIAASRRCEKPCCVWRHSRFESLLPGRAATTSTQPNASQLGPLSGGHQVVARAASVVRQLDVPRNLV